MHKTTHNKMKWFKDTYLNKNESLEILDVGSLDTSGKNFNYKSIFNENNWNYTGLDFQNGKNVDILVDDIYNWFEIEDNSYDVIISGQLFEHLEYFWLAMGEIERVLKPGGYCCIIAPSGGNKHGVADTDCYRFNEDGMKAIANYVDFEVLHISTNKDKEAHPWCDTCLVAKKEGINANTEEIEQRINNLEDKLDLILNKLNK